MNCCPLITSNNSLAIETSGQSLFMNRDWDRCYLNDILSQDFYEFTNMWDSNIYDMDLIEAVKFVEKYSPIYG